MSSLGVGKEILSYCNRCKLSLAHIIVTMADSAKVGKVQCKTCQSTHIHRGEKGASQMATAKKKTRKTAKKNPKSKKAIAESAADLWLEVVGNATEDESQKYSPKEVYKMGDIIAHPKFGPGLIDKLIDENKIQVIFQNDVKTLIHNHK